jgi:hypothetical protein
MPLSDDNPYAAPAARGTEPPVLAQPVEESESAVRIDYHLTLDDLVEFNLYHHRNSPALWRHYLLVRLMLVAVALAAAVPALIAFSTFNRMEGVSFASITVLFALFLWWSSRAAKRRSYFRKILSKMYSEGRNDNLFGLHRLWVSRAGVRHITRYKDVTCQWPVVEKIVAGPRAAYLYDSAATAIIVPQGAFASEAEFQRFVETARQFWKDAQLFPSPFGKGLG